MKKICVITSARSEYGHLKWIIRDINDDPELELQLIVTGGHLSREQGYTINEVYSDDIPIAKAIDVHVDNASRSGIGKTMSRIGENLAVVFDELEPDMLVVLGDRYELLPICSTALVMDIPIAHISGGDVTEGAIDNEIRNAITMISSYHFPGTPDAARNISRMRNSEKNIFVIGELSLDLFNRMLLLSRIELAENLGLDPEKKWVLLTYHPETRETLSYNMKAVQNTVAVLQDVSDIEIVMTSANLDFGGNEINNFLISAANNRKFKFFHSLGQLRYLSLMKQVAFVIGNSSSGIVETPFLSIPAVNIGQRQKGRYLCKNIVQSGISRDEIHVAINASNRCIDTADKYYWGDGKSSERFVRALKDV